jgi:transposase
MHQGADVTRIMSLQATPAWWWSGCCQWRLLPREFPPWGTVYHYFRLWRNTTVWVHLYRGEREKPVIRLSSACSQAKLGLDLQAWINRTRWWSAQGSARRHLGPKRSLAVMPRPEGLQVRLMGCNRQPRADLFSQLAQAAQVAGRVRVGFGLGPVQNRL